MRIRQPLTSPLYPKIRFAFTDHPITVWIASVDAGFRGFSGDSADVV
jgi:hypothetical protein